MNIKPTLLVALLAGLAFNASAADRDLLTDCVDLGSDQEIVRPGGTRSFLLRAGDDHYLVGFRGDCSSLPTASRLEIATGDASNRLCATGTTVRTKRETCQVNQVQAIDAEQFASRKKRASR